MNRQTFLTIILALAVVIVLEEKYIIPALTDKFIFFIDDLFFSGSSDMTQIYTAKRLFVSLLVLLLDYISLLIQVLINLILSINITLTGTLYTLVVLFIISSISSAFNGMKMSIQKLKIQIEKNNKNQNTDQNFITDLDLARALQDTENHIKSLVEKDSTKNNNALLDQAKAIKELLEKISSSQKTTNDIDKNRVKKERRSTVEINEIDNIKPIKKVAKKKVAKKKASKKIISKDKTDIDIMDDENISKIDLARALIESNDKAKAKEILMKVIDSGTENESHEAKLLYMQLM